MFFEKHCCAIKEYRYTGNMTVSTLSVLFGSCDVAAVKKYFNVLEEPSIIEYVSLYDTNCTNLSFLGL